MKDENDKKGKIKNDIKCTLIWISCIFTAFVFYACVLDDYDLYLRKEGESPYDNGYNAGYEEGYEKGYEKGYKAGFEDNEYSESYGKAMKAIDEAYNSLISPDDFRQQISGLYNSQIADLYEEMYNEMYDSIKDVY